jgi:predicted DNA-binding transcriptional regulator AlpA
MGNLICEKVLRTRLGGVSHMWVRRRLQSDATFPRFIRLGKRQKFWREDEIAAWVDQRARLTAQEGGAA